MTREQTKEAIKVMQAFVDGKDIEINHHGYNLEWKKCKEPKWNWIVQDYRIAPDQEEPKEKRYRPYTMEEFVEDLKIHGNFIIVKCALGEQYVMPTCIRDTGIVLNGQDVSYESLQVMFYSWADGTRCRKEVTE